MTSILTVGAGRHSDCGDMSASPPVKAADPAEAPAAAPSVTETLDANVRAALAVAALPGWSGAPSPVCPGRVCVCDGFSTPLNSRLGGG